ncbi:hypothetical protein EJB05_15008, partial [Eragrostis curvula]
MMQQDATELTRDENVMTMLQQAVGGHGDRQTVQQQQAAAYAHAMPRSMSGAATNVAFQPGGSPDAEAFFEPQPQTMNALGFQTEASQQTNGGVARVSPPLILQRALCRCLHGWPTCRASHKMMVVTMTASSLILQRTLASLVQAFLLIAQDRADDPSYKFSWLLGQPAPCTGAAARGSSVRAGRVLPRHRGLLPRRPQRGRQLRCINDLRRRRRIINDLWYFRSSWTRDGPTSRGRGAETATVTPELLPGSARTPSAAGSVATSTKAARCIAISRTIDSYCGVSTESVPACAPAASSQPASSALEAASSS